MTFLGRLVVAVALLLSIAASAFADDVRVRGYIRKDGTYVAPHWRSAPDSSVNNNWSTSPNVNPYTGQQGTRAPRFEPFQPMQPVQPFGSQRETNPWGR
jgi:hypothetical protein